MDSERTSRQAIADCLERAGHRVRAAAAGDEALNLAREEAPDFVITELALPDVSGLGLCRSLREDPSFARVPILMLSASSAEMDRVVAFEVGVDDFVTKPFHPRELALRVAAILRRARKATAAPHGELLRHLRLVVDLGQHEVRVDDQLVLLTAREFDVLACMMQSAGRGLSRRKLGPAGDYIETLRGVGYRFSDEDGSTEAARPPRPELRPVANIDRAS